MPRSILVVNVAWNSSQWKCPNINDFHNRHRYGFPFVQTVGFHLIKCQNIYGIIPVILQINKPNYLYLKIVIYVVHPAIEYI